MSLSTDLHRIKRIALVRLSPGNAGYGVAWTRDDGRRGSERIGTRAQAEAVLQDLGARQDPRTAVDELMPFEKDVAAS